MSEFDIVVGDAIVIDGTGAVDLRTHYDAHFSWDPYLALSGWHGVTSAVIGNCGFGFAPMRPLLVDDLRAFFRPLR
jgi:N-acyl-D-aspartate/D-glutamate deacylase